MATTTLAALSNRYGSDYYIQGSVTSVALDANVSEDFLLPTGFGSILIQNIGVVIGALSGAYVAVAPATEGVELFIVSGDATTRQDILGSIRLRNTGTASARPQLSGNLDFNRRVLMRLGERVRLQAPVIAGAGVTGTIQLAFTGLRFQTG